MFKKRFWLSGLLLLVSHFCAAENNPQPQSKQLNVLMISVDDLNDWVGVLGGHPQASTPNIDRLAQRGMLFTNAHTPSPVCNSARTAIMTGLMPSTTGIYRNGVSAKQTVNKHLTISESFKQNGYYTAGAGKLLHLFYYKAGAWDEHMGRFPDPKAKGKDSYRIAGDQFMVGQLANTDEDKTMDVQTTDWVIKRIMQKRDKPFFIAAGIYRPHVPWLAPKKYFDEFPPETLTRPLVKDDDLDDVGEIAFKFAMTNADQDKTQIIPADINDSTHAKIVSQNEWGRAMQAYLASVKHADNQVGRILDALDNSPYKDNTAIVLWSDHGWHFGEKQHWRKGTLWEEATRIPFIISIPGQTTAGSRSDEAVSLIDLFPTLIDSMGFSTTAKLSGESLLPMLQDPTASKKSPAITEYYEGNVAVRDDRYRFIHYINGDEELYDHQVDPQEWTNLANNPEFLSIKKQLATWLPKKFIPEKTSLH